MYKRSLSVAIALAAASQGAHAADPAPQGFIEGSRASVSSRTMYFNNDNHEGGADQRETATGLKFDYLSGFTQGVVGFGLDAQALVGIHLDGGRGYHPNNNSFFPSDTDGSAEKTFTRAGANAKARFSKTELKVGNALAPSMPVIVPNDGRLLPQSFEGGIITSKEIDNLTLNAGKLTKAAGRASSNYSGMAVSGGTEDSNNFVFGGGDYKVTKDLTLQYYYANLENYYKQNFLGLVHVYQIDTNQTFKTDLRYFDSSSDGKNGDVGYRFNNNGGYAKNAGEVDNKTWSAMFTYTLGSHAIMLGHQQVGDDGGFVWMNNGNVTDGRGRNEGAGGASFYLFTDSMINQFARAGENTTFGQYTFDFAKAGVPGLKATAAYLRGDDIKDVSNGREHTEWERDLRLDYVVQAGALKGLGASLRHGTYRGDNSGSVASTDQTRLIFNYTYNFM